MNFGGQSASRAADRLIAVFFGAPAACWWARTMVLSMKTSSKSASPASSAKTVCHTCARDHLAKRLYTLFQAPKSGGRSRHGLPVRAIHSTASTNCRLSAAVRPASVALPGSSWAIRAYWSSLSINLGILNVPKIQDVNRFLQKLTAPPGQLHEKLFTHNGLRMGVVNCCEDALTLGFAKSREWCGRRIRAVEFARRVWGPEGSACTHSGA